MEPLAVLGIFVAGAGVGALLTSIAYSGKMQAIRDTLRRLTEMDVFIENATRSSHQSYRQGEEDIAIRPRG